MARPGLQKHPKFRRLVHMLQLPVPYVVGLLECLWDVAYESGNAEIGDATDVELAAQWPATDGTHGTLCSALASCGGEGRSGFIEERGGRYYIHDLFHHAPEYVTRRKNCEKDRQVERICKGCGSEFFSGKSWAEYCSDYCRKSSYRNNKNVTHGETHGTDERTHDASDASKKDATPAPAPAPAPLLKETPLSPLLPKRFTKPTIDEVRAYCLERKNSIDPEQFMDYYESNGWKVGRNPMKDWKAAVRHWEKNRKPHTPRLLTDEEVENL